MVCLFCNQWLGQLLRPQSIKSHYSPLVGDTCRTGRCMLQNSFPRTVASPGKIFGPQKQLSNGNGQSFPRTVITNSALTSSQEFQLINLSFASVQGGHKPSRRMCLKQLLKYYSDHIRIRYVATTIKVTASKNFSSNNQPMGRI